MALVPLTSWNVQIFNRNELSLSTLYNSKQETASNTYEYTYEYPTNFFSLNTTIEKSFSENSGGRDRYSDTWTVTTSGFYRITTSADESVDHWIYVNGRQFLHNSGGQRNTANLYMYLNQGDVVEFLMNNDNDFDTWTVLFRRVVDVYEYQYRGTSIKTPYLNGDIDA